MQSKYQVFKKQSSDREMIEKGEARVIFRSWEVTKDNQFVRGMLERAEKMYGMGAKERIRSYLTQMKEGTLE
jgi:hypothetical protein